MIHKGNGSCELQSLHPNVVRFLTPFLEQTRHCCGTASLSMKCCSLKMVEGLPSRDARPRLRCFREE